MKGLIFLKFRSYEGLIFISQKSVGTLNRVRTAQGKWGGGENPCQDNHGKFENFAKTQGILHPQVECSLMKDIAIFAAKFSFFFLRN